MLHILNSYLLHIDMNSIYVILKSNVFGYILNITIIIQHISMLISSVHSKQQNKLIKKPEKPHVPFQHSEYAINLSQSLI